MRVSHEGNLLCLRVATLKIGFNLAGKYASYGFHPRFSKDSNRIFSIVTFRLKLSECGPGAACKGRVVIIAGLYIAQAVDPLYQVQLYIFLFFPISVTNK